MVAVVQLVRASDCGSECRRFESDQPPTEEETEMFLLFFVSHIIIKIEEEHYNALPLFL